MADAHCHQRRAGHTFGPDYPEKTAWKPAAQHLPEPITLTTPEDSIIQKERHQRLTQGLRTLPKAQQRAMWLRYIKELSYREIVWEMQAPLGTVKIWLHRGRHQLKRARWKNKRSEAGAG